MITADHIFSFNHHIFSFQTFSINLQQQHSFQQNAHDYVSLYFQKNIKMNEPVCYTTTFILSVRYLRKGRQNISPNKLYIYTAITSISGSIECIIRSNINLVFTSVVQNKTNDSFILQISKVKVRFNYHLRYSILFLNPCISRYVASQ